MKVAPYRRAPGAQPLGLVTRTRRVILEDGSRPRLRDAPAGVKLYADAHIVNERFLRRGDGRALAWNERPVRWISDLERSVILLQGFPGDGDDAMDGLVSWRDALADHGARIGSPSAASLSLLRTTLREPLYLGNDRPRLSQVLGGRQESFREAGTYGRHVHLDMSAAYARTLGELVYPVGAWLSLGTAWPDAEIPMMVRARVRIPAEIAHGPLPLRPRRRLPPAERAIAEIDYPTGRTVQGLWASDELRVAEAAGCEVRPLEVWALVGRVRRPFEAWWALIRAGRRLTGLAGDLFKLMGNTLWGRFALAGDMAEVRYSDGRLVASRPLRRVGLNPAYGAEDVSELVASSVRGRLYADLIAPHADRLVSVHTDGGLVLGTRPPRMPEPWRIKHVGSLVVFLGPQLYAYVPAGDVRERAWRYVCSGIPPTHAPAVFGGLVREVLGWPPFQPTEGARRYWLGRMIPGR